LLNWIGFCALTFGVKSPGVGSCVVNRPLFLVRADRTRPCHCDVIAFVILDGQLGVCGGQLDCRGLVIGPRSENDRFLPVQLAGLL
jgi:hypothetical protein